MNPLNKLLFARKKPRLVIISGNKSLKTKEAVVKILKFHKAVKNVAVFEKDLNNPSFSDFDFALKNSSLSLLLVLDRGVSQSKTEEMIKRFKNFPQKKKFLVLNSDDEFIKSFTLNGRENLQIITFAIKSPEADFKATDINVNGGTNFKIDYKGKIVPFWIEKVVQESEIYPPLAAAVVGTVLDLNLVEISEALRGFE